MLFIHPSQLVETAWGFIALLISVVAMAMQHVEMERERSELGIP